MSLIVTSNIGQDEIDESNAFKPFSYQNALRNTYKIPANSEIALQSAKINKNSLLVIDRTNTTYCHYFGTPIGGNASTEIDNIESSTTTPFFGIGGTGSAFRDGKRLTRNTTDFANDLEKSFAETAFHPSLITGENPVTADIVVEPNYVSGTNAFDGYKWTFTQQTAKTTLNNASIDDNFTDISVDSQGGFTATGGTITSTSKNGFYAQTRLQPISQNNGTCIMNFDGLNTGLPGGRNPFIVGLSRINTQKDFLGSNISIPNAYNFGANQNAPFFQTGIQGRGFYDVCIVRKGDLLYVMQSGTSSSGGICMNEVTYYGSHNKDFATQYDIATNNSSYTKVRYTIQNEEIKIELGTAANSYTTLCDFTTLNAAGAVKNECLNPLNCAKWNLFPTFSCSRGTGKTLTIENLQHYTNYPSYTDTNYMEHNWWGKVEFNGEENLAEDVESRLWNSRSSTILLAPKGVNASGGMKDYRNTIITAKSLEYGEDVTNQANSQMAFGFSGRPISFPDSASDNVKTIVKSLKAPTITSGASLFVRLNNFTQTSLNARQGSISKIVAHLPRFDNGGNETGALYFEPHEKTYIDLNNPEDLYINSFDVDIVYDNETFCTALNGKTIICFHIRKKLVR
jgi:hypothetical protein